MPNYMPAARPVALLAIGLVCAELAPAQVQRSGSNVNAQLMQQYQQVMSERTQLQAQNERLSKQLDDLKKQLDASKKQVNGLKAGVSRSSAELAAAQAANDSTAKSLADTKDKMQELIGRFRETATQLRDVEGERTQLQQQLAQGKNDFDRCVQRNYDLYRINGEVLDRYEHQGMFSYLARGEPFTRLKRTEIDNLVDEYRERAEELRLQHKAGSTAASPAPKASEPPSH